MASSSEPNVGIDIKEEMEKPYVKAYRSHFDEKEVSDEKLVTAIELLSRLEGGTHPNRRAERFCEVVDHILQSEGKTDEEILRSFPGFSPSPSEFEDLNSKVKERQQKKNMRIKKLSYQKGQKIQPIGLEQDIQDLHKKEQQRQAEHALLQEKKQRREAEHALLQEKQQRQEAENALLQEKQQRQAERQELLSLMEDNFVLLGENFADQLDLLLEKKCKICSVNEAEILFKPCNHILACKVCVDKLRNQAYPGKCPYCNSALEETTKVYIV